MSEATISFADHDQIRTLFGAQDRHLRQVRDQVGVDVVVRGDELRLQGSDEQVQRGVTVLSEMRDIIERTGGLTESEVDRALGIGPGTISPSEGSEIDLFSKARKVHPRTPGQSDYVDAIRRNEVVFSAGPAGCGKTYLAVAMAINALRQERVRKIMLTRPAVEAGEKLGFLPGDMLAKVNPYLRPLLDALHDLLDFDQVKSYMERDVIEIIPLAFMRGRTLNDTYMILDEAQNTTITQMKMFLTRMGINSRIIVTGDTTQIDLPPHVPSGLIDAMGRLGGIEGVGTVSLTGADIVRHPLVREMVRAYEEKDGTGKKSRGRK